MNSGQDLPLSGLLLLPPSV